MVERVVEVVLVSVVETVVETVVEIVAESVAGVVCAKTIETNPTNKIIIRSISIRSKIVNPQLQNYHFFY